MQHVPLAAASGWKYLGWVVYQYIKALIQYLVYVLAV